MKINDLLLHTSELVRSKISNKKLGKKFKRGSDLIGADFRDANVSGADLTGSIFLTQAQVNAAKGNMQTKLPASLRMPEHWKQKA